MDNNKKRNDTIDPRTIPQIPNQENESKQEGAFRNVKEKGSSSSYGHDYEVEQEEKMTEEEAATEPEKDN